MSKPTTNPFAPGFHLLATRDEVVRLPERVTYLVTEPLAARVRSPERNRGVRLEPVQRDGEHILLLAASQDTRVRKNGLPVPPVAILRVGDELRLDEGPVLFVTEYCLPRIETPTGRLLERDCGLCRTALTPETRVLVHKCGVALHLEPDSVPEEERLSCATAAGECPSCGLPVRTEEGFTWLPA